uniref:Uncharacterized protein n=1 Tax=Hucho hucho TaxID=62062 RepID=A0A4W5NDB7_9TELE
MFLVSRARQSSQQTETQMLKSQQSRLNTKTPIPSWKMSGLEYQLPQHQRCACHLLNLTATTDSALAETNSDSYKSLSRSSFAKCQAMWNKTGRSTLAAEVVENEYKLQLIRPNQTRWNSTFLAVERITRIIQENGEDAIRNAEPGRNFLLE